MYGWLEFKNAEFNFLMHLRKFNLPAVGKLRYDGQIMWLEK